MTNKSFDELLNGYEHNLLTEEELAIFLQLLQKEESVDRLRASVEQSFKDNTVSGQANPNRADLIFQKIMDGAHKEEETQKGKVVSMPGTRKRFSFLRIAAAASVLGLLVLGTYFFSKSSEKEIAQREGNNQRYKNDVLPGGSKAVLTLADGTTIELDEAKSGTLARQGNTRIIQMKGKLAYHAAGTGAGEVVYNTLSTPRGGQYQVELPDGTQVWLNAASSLHLPSAFAGKERRVEVSGEAYFEVAKNKNSPFIVSVHGAEVQVLGTHFNVMAYQEEQVVKTTLLEGAVKFVSGSADVLLHPGQQSQLTNKGEIKVVSGVDTDEVVAWKNGMFSFHSAGLETVMQQLSRWYDVEVIFKSKKAFDPLTVEIPRHTNLTDALKALELSGSARFEIEGKRVVVKQ